jgi:hypothetical protein
MIDLVSLTRSQTSEDQWRFCSQNLLQALFLF